MILIMAPVNISSSTIIPAWEGGRQRAPSIPGKRRRTGKNISVVQIFSKMKSLYLVLDSLSFGFIIKHYSSFIMGWLMLMYCVIVCNNSCFWADRQLPPLRKGGEKERLGQRDCSERGALQGHTFYEMKDLINWNEQTAGLGSFGLRADR